MKKTRTLTTMAILAAMSVVFVALIHFPIFPAVAFLEYDPADIPILICGFAFGPWAGLAVTVIAAVIQGLTVSAQSGVYGIIMHILATGAYVTVSSLLYQRKKSRGMAAASLAAGCVARTLCMLGANLVVTPYFMMGAVNAGTVGAVWQLMPFIVLFNLVASCCNGLITFFLYKRVKNLFFHEKKTRVNEAGIQ